MLTYPGITKTILQGRPQLVAQSSDPNVNALATRVNQLINAHGINPRKSDGTPAVNKPLNSLHTHVNAQGQPAALAVDISFGGETPADFNQYIPTNSDNVPLLALKASEGGSGGHYELNTEAFLPKSKSTPQLPFLSRIQWAGVLAMIQPRANT